MAIVVLISVTLIILFASLCDSVEHRNRSPSTVAASSNKIEMEIAERVRITIVYDNNAYDERLVTAWGFSCYINVDNVTVLFDTGGDARILLDNMAKLNLNVEEIDVIVLSHIHGDHVGGLFGVLELNSQVKVYLPASFPDEFKNEVKKYGCEVVEVKDAVKISHGLATTGELDAIKEQSLMIAMSKGLVVITGCAHPGVVNIVKKAKELTDMDIYLVMGGFHLTGASESTILSIIEQLKELEVKKVAPCHCSGDLARKLFKEKFGEDYLEVGVGSDP